MKAPDVITIDFETESIESRPAYPPKPVGVSIKWPKDRSARYYAWGHPTKNNCTEAMARVALTEALASEFPLLFHNAKFDVDVWQTHMMKLSLPISWARIHDTQFLLFLHDPHAMSLALKPSAERLLGMKPEERDAVNEWILNNVPAAAKKPSTAGGYICKAPGDLVGKYANGDVVRTEKLFKHLYPIIEKEGMMKAYDRERELMPIFLENERKGLRVDVPALKRDIPVYRAELEKAETWLRKRLKVSKEFNFDSDAEMATALNDSGIVTEWEMTKTGKRSTSKKTMTVEKFSDKKVFLVLGYRNRLTTCLRMFMEPWLEKAKVSGGFILPTWNQVRQPKGDDGNKGTRTGRPSCDDPNLLNLAKSFEDRGDDYTHPKFVKLLPLPLIRRYTLPDEGCVWLHRDFNQQELRILAHFEDGQIMKAYQENPRLDLHTFVQEEIKKITHMDADRGSVKILNFSRVYGAGLGNMALRLKRPIEEVRAIRDAQNKALPGLPELDQSIKDMAKRGEPIVTWGGRVYYCEEPKFVERFGRVMSFEYKMLNVLVQGSAADATKESIIRYHNHPKRRGRLLVTVYDEINVSVNPKYEKEEMKILRECMEGLEFDVVMLSDGKSGNNWGNLKKYADS